MTLPIDFVGIQWFMPTPIWELEDDVVSAPTCGAACPSVDDSRVDAGTLSDQDAQSADNDAQAACTPPPVTQHMVFMGYSNQVRYGWLPATTPVSRPWERAVTDDCERRHRAKPSHQVEGVPGAASSTPSDDSSS